MTEPLDESDDLEESEEQASDRLLDQVARGRTADPSALAALLGAARATDQDGQLDNRALPGEESAVAAFRQAFATAPTGTPPRRRHRVVRLAAAGALLAASLTGVVYGVRQTGARLPFLPSNTASTDRPSPARPASAPPRTPPTDGPGSPPTRSGASVTAPDTGSEHASRTRASGHSDDGARPVRPHAQGDRRDQADQADQADQGTEGGQGNQGNQGNQN